jgi:methionyl-tRNA formyltransferase
VHGSLLPKWRGAAPIQRALEAGDNETGVTIMQMDKGLDTGDMILKAHCAITATDTSATLYEKLAALGPKALLTTLEKMAQGTYQREEQNSAEATYAHKLAKAEAELNWQLPADVLERKIRAYNPWPIAQFTFTDNSNKQHRIRIWQASVITANDSVHAAGTIVEISKKAIIVATGKNHLALEMLQLPGKKTLPVSDILNARAEWFKAGNMINGNTTQELH